MYKAPQIQWWHEKNKNSFKQQQKKKKKEMPKTRMMVGNPRGPIKVRSFFLCKLSSTKDFEVENMLLKI